MIRIIYNPDKPNNEDWFIADTAKEACEKKIYCLNLKNAMHRYEIVELRHGLGITVDGVVQYWTKR